MIQSLASWAAVLVLLAGGQTVAIAAGAPGDFQCRNTAAEITCDGQSCEVNTGFTPKSVSREGGKLMVCAYSGCGEGKLDLIRTRGDLTFLHATLAGGPVNGPAALVYDRKRQVATLLWHSYAEPLNCGAQP